MEHNRDFISRDWKKADSNGCSGSSNSSSITDNGNGSLPAELDRKLPPSIQSNYLPLTFVHVPANHDDVGGIFNQWDNDVAGNTASYPVSEHEIRRSPSVQDFVSHNNMLNATYAREGGGSVEIYHRKSDTRLDKKEQFEERLRRAHLRIQNSPYGSHPDTDTTFTAAAAAAAAAAAGNAIESSTDKRYRSKSTPSRSASGRVLTRLSFQRQVENTNSLRSGRSESSINCSMQRLGDIDRHNETNGETANLLYPHAQVDLQSKEHDDAVINSHVGTTAGPLDTTLNFSSKSYAGSDHDILLEGEGQHTIPEPPPPPPPATEKERLVERERQARLESERARRRHLALQRERLQEEYYDVEENVASDDVNMNGSTNGGRLGQVSFDAGLQLEAPEFVGDSALILGVHHEGRSSTGSSINIPIPPLPPPATERERLVERERQARLETERARRRQALLRERHQEENGDEVENDWTDTAGVVVFSANGSDFDHVSFEGPGIDPSQIHETNGEVRLHALDPILLTDVEANNISYPMERFLEKTNNGESITVPVDMENDTALPYTMELFLAEHANRGHTADSGVIETSDTQLDNISSHIERIINAPTDQGTLIYDDDDNIHTNHNSEHSPMTLTARGADRHSENTWISHVSASSRSQDLNVADSIPRLTEADIAQFSEVEHASLGNAPPQSVRDEPSEPSVVGRGAYVDHAFSVATQTTVIESVTEASVCQLESAFSDINESEESVNVIRLGSVISESMHASDGASSASIEAMPSRASSDSSHAHSVGSNDALSHSDASSHLSFDGVGHCPLTEAVIVSQAEIDCASIGNTPPHSIRDDCLSESSIIERTGPQPINIGARIGEHIVVGVQRMAYDSDDHGTLSNENDTASVEAIPSVHSDQSIVVTPSEVNDRMRDFNEDTIIYHSPDLISRTSVEMLPSIDLGDEGGIHDYGATSNEEFRSSRGDNSNVDIEAAPLLLLRKDRRSRSSSCSNSSSPNDSSTPTPSLVLIIAELPTFVIIARGNDHLCSILGMQKFQSVLASLVVTSLLNHSAGEEIRNRTQQHLDRSFIFEELQRGFIFGIFNGFFIGLIGFLCHFDYRLGVVLALSVCVAIVVSKLCKTFFMLLLQKLDGRQQNRLIQPGMAGLLDFICCLVISNLVNALYRHGQ